MAPTGSSVSAAPPFRSLDTDPIPSVLDLLVIPELLFTVSILGLLALTVSLAFPRQPVTGVAGVALLLAGAAGLTSVPITQSPPRC
jgi:membrane-bound ClpP family serine protease